MSRFMSKRYAGIDPYVPGEQPQGREYIKLNTNESPFDVSANVLAMAHQELRSARLYPDPTYAKLRAALADTYGVQPDQVFVGNGSDEILNYCFMAFCDAEAAAAENRPAVVFPDITYGFYPVIAKFNGLPYETIPLRDDFTVGIEDYFRLGSTICVANPNAPTGIALDPDDIARIASENPTSIVIVDEAYVDFGAKSCIPLVKEYPNLLVAQTFSKSRSMAGARLGFAVANTDVVADLEALRNATNPYNVNSWAVALAIAVLANADETVANCRTIAMTREYTTAGLMELGFTVLPSSANFVYAKVPGMSGRAFYQAMKDRGILVRYLDGPRQQEYVRITIGRQDDMQALLATAADVLGNL